MRLIASILLFCLAMVVTTPAQGVSQSSLSRLPGPTDLLYWGTRSFMFDVVTTNPITICGFDLLVGPGAWTVELYARTGGGSFVGIQGNPGAWSLVATTTVQSPLPPVPTLYSSPPGVATPVVFPNLALPIPAGSTQGLTITLTPLTPGIIHLGLGLLGFTQPTPPIANADFLVTDGMGVVPPFQYAVSNRRFLGTIFYAQSALSGCSLPNPPRPYQLNQPTARATVNGLPEPGPALPIRAQMITHEQATLTFGSTLAQAPFDVAVTPGVGAVPLGSGGVGTLGGQTVNLSLTSPALSFVLGGPLPNLVTTAFPGPEIVVPFSPPVPGTFSAQMVVLNPTHLDGYSLSHVLEIVSVPCALPESFETASPSPFYNPSGWVNGFQGLSWELGIAPFLAMGSVPTPIPAGYHAAYYLFGRPSSTLPVQFLTCPIPLASAPNQQLTFLLHRDAAAGGTLTIRQTDAVGMLTMPIATYAGASPSGVGWTIEVVPFVNYGPATKFLFTLSGSVSATFAVDLISVQ